MFELIIKLISMCLVGLTGTAGGLLILGSLGPQGSDQATLPLHIPEGTPWLVGCALVIVAIGFLQQIFFGSWVLRFMGILREKDQEVDQLRSVVEKNNGLLERQNGLLMSLAAGAWRTTDEDVTADPG